MTESFSFGKFLTLFAAQRVLHSWTFKVSTALAVVALGMATATTTASAQAVSNNCAILPGNAALKNALAQAMVAEASGLNLNMWATIVARDGTVCAVAFSGNTSGSQWLGSPTIRGMPDGFFPASRAPAYIATDLLRTGGKPRRINPRRINPIASKQSRFSAPPVNSISSIAASTDRCVTILPDENSS
jgi:hypothetical protein